VRAEPRPADRGWQVSIGPYLWASSVEANVSLGGSVSTGVDIGFIPLVQHAGTGPRSSARSGTAGSRCNGDLMYGAEAVKRLDQRRLRDGDAVRQREQLAGRRRGPATS